MSDSLENLIGRNVVLDTEGPIIVLGRLVSEDANGFWLEQADMHNCREGHAPREQYLIEAAVDGIHVNRTRVYVFKRFVTCVSALEDVVTD